MQRTHGGFEPAAEMVGQMLVMLAEHAEACVAFQVEQGLDEVAVALHRDGVVDAVVVGSLAGRFEH